VDFFFNSHVGTLTQVICFVDEPPNMKQRTGMYNGTFR